MSPQFTGTFFTHFAVDPYLNMAFDEWLLRRAIANPGSIFLRLYTWKVGTITFGYNQHLETALDWKSVGTTPVIRRITGGRALYHDPSELTYAVAANSSAGASLSGSLAAASVQIARALQKFLDQVGVEAEYVQQSSVQNSRPEFFHKAPCFESAAKYELISGKGKVVASAQKRVGSAFLQHGSIKLRGVAGHKALDGANSDRPESLQPIDSDTFSSVSHLFGKVCGVHFGVAFENSESHDILPEILSDAEKLRKNALQKRPCD
jgi:lipoate-protein ligase A